MANKIYKFVTIMLLVVLTGISVSSCGGNDEPKGATIVGKWECYEVTSDDDGESSVQMMLTLNKDMTGSIVETWTTQTRAFSNEVYSMDFSWATSSDSNGNDILKVSYISGDKNTELFYGNSNTVLWTRQYVLTGNILNIYGGDGVWVFKRKK